MIAAQSHRGRRILGRLDRGVDLIRGILDLCAQTQVRSGEVRATGTLEDVEFSSFDRDGRSEGRKAAGGRRLTTPVQLLQLGGTVMEHQGGLTLSAFVTVARETDGGLQVLGGPLGTARVNLVEVVIEAFDDLLLRRGLDERSGVVTLVEAIELAPPVAPATAAPVAAAPAAAAPRASESRGAAAAIAEPAAPATPPITTATSAPPRPAKTAAAASASAARNAEIPMTGLRRSSPSPAAGVRAPQPPAPEVLPDEDEDEEHESSAALDDSFDDEALAELAAQTDPDDEIDDDDELASVLRAPPARPLTPARPAVVAPPKVAARPEAAPAKVAAKPEVAAKAADSTDWDAVKAASDRAQAEGEGGDLPRRGDYIDHATFGRCYVERVEESMERISVRVRAGRLVQLSLEYLSLEPIGREGNARLFRAVKRKP